MDYADAWNRYPPEGGEELCGDIDADRFRHLILNSAPVFPGVRDLVARAVRNFWIRRAAFHVEAASNDPAKEAAHAKAAEQYESDFRHAESELADSLGEGSDTVERSGDTPALLERTRLATLATVKVTCPYPDAPVVVATMPQRPDVRDVVRVVVNTPSAPV